MYALFTDETNSQPSNNVKFFIYGGLFFPLEKLVELDEQIEAIRLEAGYLPCDKLKFDTRVRPSQVSIESATKAKKQVVELCLNLGCRFISYVILHDIIKSQPQEKKLLYGANHVIGRFNQYLTEANSYGICAIDNLPINTNYQYLAEKFTYGLETQNGKKKIRLDRIKLFTTTCINASHASSAMDIVLGCFRYCVNDPKNREVAREMMITVTQMMWHERKGNTLHVAEKGLIARPKLENIRLQIYRAEYDRLLARLENLINGDEELLENEVF